MKNRLKIGELAIRVHCPVATVRFYEREGLLHTPARSESNYRLYDDEDAERLLFIRNCRSFDMTLDEIRTLLALRDVPRQDCGEVNALLDAHIGHVADRIAELGRLRLQLKKLRCLCDEVRATEECGIIHELEKSQVDFALPSQGKRAVKCCV